MRAFLPLKLQTYLVEVAIFPLLSLLPGFRLESVATLGVASAIRGSSSGAKLLFVVDSIPTHNTLTTNSCQAFQQGQGYNTLANRKWPNKA